MAMFCSKLRREWGIPMPCVHRLQVDRMSFTYHQTRVTVKPASHVLVMLCNLKERHVKLNSVSGLSAKPEGCPICGRLQFPALRGWNSGCRCQPWLHSAWDCAMLHRH